MFLGPFVTKFHCPKESNGYSFCRPALQQLHAHILTQGKRHITLHGLEIEECKAYILSLLDIFFFPLNFHFFFSYSCNKLKLAKYENAINFNYLLLSIGQNKLHFAIPVNCILLQLLKVLTLNYKYTRAADIPKEMDDTKPIVHAKPREKQMQ
ncbi:hypothetical protein M9H77_31542 [Catharanthus roseus]|uniref:Uncharacterized protein n=1 Tax=Catharanthus roseus TaxID=4058 RepID=A0ACC0A0C5_CATRO|nr:hypothetical protein M9H77_31542 [Catharanthus roseus]